MAFIKVPWIVCSSDSDPIWLNTDRILFIEPSGGRSLVHFSMDSTPETRMLLDISPEELTAHIERCRSRT